MEWLEALRESPVLLQSAVVLLGLAVGSFLNVVVARLPVMMQRAWRDECAEITGTAASAPHEPLSLTRPGSRCPRCGHAIRAWENVPIVSYLLLRGR